MTPVSVPATPSPSATETTPEARPSPTGKEPDEIAAKVLDAIKNDRFWVITHNDLQPAIEARFAGMLDAMPAD